MQLTPEEMHEFQRAARRTWDIIGDDVLSGDLEAEISRDDVLELVLDADRLTTFNPGIAPRIKQYLKETSFTQLKQDLLPAFPYQVYGY